MVASPLNDKQHESIDAGPSRQGLFECDSQSASKRQRMNVPRILDEEVLSELSLPSVLIDDFDSADTFDTVVGPSLGAIYGDVTDIDHDHRVVSVHSPDGSIYRIQLKGEWERCRTHTGQRVCVVLDSGRQGPGVFDITVDSETNYLVTDPDILFPATLLADSFTCTRRTVLSVMTQPSVEDSKPSLSLLLGSVVHNAIESFLMESAISEDAELTDDYITARLEELINIQFTMNGECLCANLYACEGTMKQVIEESRNMLRSFPLWFREHFCRSHKRQRVVDIEENVWSVKYGIKGKIDLTVYDSAEATYKPFEIKTGKQGYNSVNHRGQLLIYTLLLSDRFGEQQSAMTSGGELYYVQMNETIKVSARRNELVGIILQRNRLAAHVRAAAIDMPLAMPDMIANEYLCSKCFQRDTCLSVERLKSSQSPQVLQRRFQELFRDLQPGGIEAFVTVYLKALQAEEEEALKAKRLLWREPEGDRVRSGRCVRATVKTTRKSCTATDSYSTILNCIEPLDMSWLSVGDAVVVSSEHRFGISIGHVVEISALNTLALSLDRPLHAGQLYCIDKDELTGGFGFLRASILKMLSDHKLCRMVVSLDAPLFEENKSGFIDDSLDGYQMEAVRHAVSSKDYALIVGMPGTGKTSTLVSFIKHVVLDLGESILLVSHTHAAVDNVLLRLVKAAPGGNIGALKILRIGSHEKIHPAVACLKFDLDRPDNAKDYFDSRMIVACTTSAINHHPLFVRRRFDWCIVDEASQLSLPASIGPIRLARRFVLVGDPWQLPPLVRSRSPDAEPLTESLFHRLYAKHGSVASRTLRKQYRMNAEIMGLANYLVYDGLLECGNEQVSQRRLLLNEQAVNTSSLITSPRLPVVYVNTDNSEEERIGTSFQNRLEAVRTGEAVSMLVQAGLDQESIAVICPYRPQLRLLRQIISQSHPKVELATVDRFQGRDFPCVIVSLVRSNPLRLVGELLRDWQRVNVAFTRAQSKLIVFGSRRTLSECETFSKFFRFIDERSIDSSCQTSNATTTN